MPVGSADLVESETEIEKGVGRRRSIQRKGERKTSHRAAKCRDFGISNRRNGKVTRPKGNRNEHDDRVPIGMGREYKRLIASHV